uniref:F-box domain-containing protein n=1 Tax=Amphimedon queenslandica TaxID=400682 RepID=A0A1X7TGL0_AMPQE
MDSFTLQIQCLLYLVGNLFDDDDKPISGLALLPRSIRIKLLLLLPAVDVHKLEGTSVTADILMDEIWETLYKERICERSDCRLSLDVNHYNYTSLFSWKDLFFSYIFSCRPTTFYEANKELSVYFTHVKESVYNDYKIATLHNVSCSQPKTVTTKKFQTRVFIQESELNDHFLDLAVTVIRLRITLKIATDNLLSLNHDILIKLTRSTEAIHFGEYCTEIEEFLKIIFIENECHIKLIHFPYIPIPGLLLDYLQQHSDLKILHVYSDLDNY